MYNTLHSVASASVVLAFFPNNWPLAFLFGMVTHFVLDAIPHGDDVSPELQANKKKFAKRMILYGLIDFTVLSVMCGLWFFYNGWSLIFAAAVSGAVLPDVMLGLGIILEKPNMFGFLDRLHHWIHNYLKIVFSPWIGLFGQILVAGFLWWRLLS